MSKVLIKSEVESIRHRCAYLDYQLEGRTIFNFEKGRFHFVVKCKLYNAFQKITGDDIYGVKFSDSNKQTNIIYIERFL